MSNRRPSRGGSRRGSLVRGSRSSLAAARFAQRRDTHIDSLLERLKEKLLRDFQQFWREQSGIWLERFDYKEAAPHLVLMAFFQRILNGGGRIIREMAAETRRLYLCVEIDHARYPIELKLRYGDQTEAEGIQQLARYMDTLGCSEGWRVIFDRNPARPWKEKIFWRTATPLAGKTLHVVGC